MSTQIPPKKTAPVAAKKPAQPNSKPVPPGTAARKRVASIPLVTRPAPKRRDWWPWNFMAGMVIVIFGIGALVWGLRAAISAPQATPVPIPTPTALAELPTQEPPQGSPVAGPVATATLAAPDALENGPYAPISQIASSVGSLDQAHIRPTLIPYIPSGQLAVSEVTHDWGQIAASGTITTVITVANIGNGPVHVDQLLTNCSCLGGNMSAKDLPVGTRASQVVLYDPGLDGKKGGVEHTLSILSTAGDETVKTLTFKATVP
jgi:hypothetical protein